MNGMVLALPKVPLDFGSTTGGATRTQVLVRALCTESLRELVLVVRVHDVLIGAGAELTIRVIPVAPTCEDPTKDFAASDVLAEASLAGTSAGTLLRSVCVLPLPTHVQLQAAVQQGSAPGNLNATVSVEILGRQ